MAKILIVEDNGDLADEIGAWLAIERHICEFAANGTDAIHYIEQDIFDLVVLDWQLPDISGIDILRKCRLRNVRVPVLMLTGKSSLQDRLTGLDTGADDYLTKPFQGEELLARVRALLRRPQEHVVDNIKYGDIVMVESSKDVTAGGAPLKLTPMEYSCLHHFIENVDKGPVSPEALKARVWAGYDHASPGAVKSCVSQLRTKLRAVNSNVSILMRHGFGYELSIGRSAESDDQKEDA